MFRNSSKHFPTNVNLIYLTFDISFFLVVWELPSEILSLMYFLVDFVNYICRVRITFLIFIRSSFDLIQLLLILYAASMRHLNESNFADKKRPVYVLLQNTLVVKLLLTLLINTSRKRSCLSIPFSIVNSMFGSLELSCS